MSASLSGSDISIIDQVANAAAVFHPAVDVMDGSETYAPPCLEIGGVLVRAYVRDGILVVSLDYVTTGTGDEPEPFAAYDGACIPTVIKAGEGPPPVWTALPEGAELPAWVFGE